MTSVEAAEKVLLDLQPSPPPRQVWPLTFFFLLFCTKSDLPAGQMNDLSPGGSLTSLQHQLPNMGVETLKRSLG